MSENERVDADNGGGEFPELTHIRGTWDSTAGISSSDFLPAVPNEPSDARVDGVPAGRDPETGRFLPGNNLGRGSPLAGQVARLRATLLDACTPEEMLEGVRALLAKFRRGDVPAAKLVLQYTLGEPQALDLLAVVARMEQVVFRGVESHG